MLQHEKASIEMFDYLVKSNDLGEEIKELDLIFIKEMIYGPLDTKTAQDTEVSHASRVV